CDAAMFSMPLAYASTLDRSGVIAAARRRGGVLEPGARRHSGKFAGKSRRQLDSINYRAEAREDLSLSSGASSLPRSSSS
ncbi:MAG TPA: hypothetical protein VKB70_01560, partial [Gaiellaceae bacterium]|nr:hypothetical protein [Gaiellaceae bacterium]